MKRTFPLLLALTIALLTVTPLHAQDEAGAWSLLDASPFHNYRFEDSSFLDPDTGFVINPDGELWKTTDGGASWELLDTVPAYLRSTVFLNEQHGFVGTVSPTDHPLYETTDGQTLVEITDRISGPIPMGICGLWAVNEDVIYGVGWFAGPAYFIKTTDGGQTWTSRDMSEYVGSLIDVYFWDEQRGIAVGASNSAGAPDTRAVVLLTEDGGDTWSVQYISPVRDRGEWTWKITFPTPTTGYVSLEGASNPAKILKTTDAGLTWSVRTIPGSPDLQGVGFITEDIGWASGRGLTSVTTDGGATWSPTSLDGSINRFEFFGDTLGYAMGQRIYTYTPPKPTDVADVVADRTLTLEPGYPNPFAESVTIPFTLARTTEVELAVFDMLGRRVAVLEAGFRTAGAHETVWRGTDEEGRMLAPGIYVVRLTAAGQRLSRTLAHVR